MAVEIFTKQGKVTVSEDNKVLRFHVGVYKGKQFFLINTNNGFIGVDTIEDPEALHEKIKPYKAEDKGCYLVNGNEIPAPLFYYKILPHLLKTLGV